MEIKKAQTAAPPKTPLQSSAPAAQAQTPAPQEQVTLGSQQEQAVAVLQQMAQARQNLGLQLIGEVIEPAPAEFQEVAQATNPVRHQIAEYISQQTGAPADEFYLLASETKMLSQAAVNAENRADFQAQSGKNADRGTLFQEELGYLAEAGIYQNMIPEQQLAEMLPQTEVQGEAALSAGTFVQEVRKHVPAETAAQVTESARQSSLFQAFQANPDLQQRFVGKLEQNYEAALKVSQGCLGYFAVLGDIMQNEMQAGAVLAASQQQGQAPQQ